jgi:hypothetical protein
VAVGLTTTTCRSIAGGRVALFGGGEVGVLG